MNYKEWLIAAIFSNEGELVVPDKYWKEQVGNWDIVRKNNSKLKQVELKITRKPKSGEAELPASDNNRSDEICKGIMEYLLNETGVLTHCNIDRQREIKGAIKSVIDCKLHTVR